jgi:hypothetical protein
MEGKLSLEANMAVTSVTNVSGAVNSLFVDDGRTAIAEKKAAPKVGNVIELEETVIEGRVQKPEAFYILQRSNLNYDALDPKKSFIPKILESAKTDTF